MVRAGQWIWADGTLKDNRADNGVSLLTHTLHYGVGAFEGIRAYRNPSGNAAVFRLGEHVRRLFDSCKLVWLEPQVSQADVEQACLDVLAKNGFDEAYLRPIVYLGAGAMGLLPVDNPVVTTVIAWPWGAYLGKDGLERGIRCKISSFRRHGAHSALSQGKIIGQYTNSVLAKREARADGYDEAILLDGQGLVAEGSGENLFLVDRGELVTPPLSVGILPGITRATIITLAAELGLTVRQEAFPREALYLADEVFLTGTAAEVTPVVEIDRHPVGDGTVGEVTRRLQQRYFDVVAGREPAHAAWLTEVTSA
jgi:branched-chain amino acid aminotransferase